MTDRRNLIRKLYYSDNLPVLRNLESESIDLIYLDPPFNSNRAYNIIYPDDMGQVTAFDDTWTWTPQCDEYIAEMKNARGNNSSLKAYDILCAFTSAMGKVQINAYLINMAIRLIEMRRILKSTGSIYLHCDPTASHYLKILMDRIFGEKNFRSEIIWRIGWVSGFKTQKKGWIRNHDTILYYLKSPTAKEAFNKEYIPYPEGYARRDGQAPTGKGVPIEDTWNCSDADRLDSIMIKSFSKEKLGYPTQKPLALLKRIVHASSNSGETVLDPFCGCGTTIAAAEVLNRQWIGIDITYSAIAAIQERFKRQRLNIWGDIDIVGEPKTVQDVERKLIHEDSAKRRKEFEKWCVTQLGGLPNENMGADGGIDGRIMFGDDEVAIISVKSGRVDVRQIRELKGLLDHRNRVGIFVTKEEPTKPMLDFAKQSGLYEPRGKELRLVRDRNVPVIQILTLDQLLQGQQPVLP